ncbi:hypothetical protein DSO57_1019324 [Entomophthora muscae]|uniref:Uncharacterized protein n=1 Tax=Entomophthora muscae TaxID=34485 RepID=A0ACC2TRR8_9FUNG|nr:hypothetical protein DSO57_1019324 [Entomophthora muscae]
MKLLTPGFQKPGSKLNISIKITVFTYFELKNIKFLLNFKLKVSLLVVDSLPWCSAGSLKLFQSCRLLKPNKATPGFQLPPNQAPKLSVAPKNVVACAQVCGVYLGPGFTYNLVKFTRPLAQLFFSAYHVRDNPTCLLYLLEDLPWRAQNLFATHKNLVKSLTCDNLDLSLPSLDLESLCDEVALAHVIPTEEPKSVPQTASALQKYVLSVIFASWGKWVMGLNSYFPQLSPVSSLWTPA